MAAIFLHEHKDFRDLLLITAEKEQVDPVLIEKDYWIMHILYGLKQQGYEFALKGGTSLSKGYKIINRFSEDIDIYIKPPKKAAVNENPKSIKPAAAQSRKEFYDWLSKDIKIPGVVQIKRDTDFDDQEHYRSGGIRLYYESLTSTLEGVKDGILLEAGFDTVAPNTPLLISSWAYEEGSRIKESKIIDNRAVDIICYHPGYTFVEKLQTIIRLYRQEQQDGKKRKNYMRQYNDIYCLLENDQVNAFIGTAEYEAHKQARIKGKDQEVAIQDNPAFRLDDKALLRDFEERYKATAALYYKGQIPFAEIAARIRANLDRL